MPAVAVDQTASATPFSTTHTRASARSSRRIFVAALGLCLAVGLTVPSSEFRAKAFRLGLMAKSYTSRTSM